MEDRAREMYGRGFNNLSLGEQQRLREDRGDQEHHSSHWNEPNILAHVRFNERTDADGARVLFIEEVQSDWHQAGRKQGYASNEQATPRVVYYVTNNRTNQIYTGHVTREEAENALKSYMATQENLNQVFQQVNKAPF